MEKLEITISVDRSEQEDPSYAGWDDVFSPSMILDMFERIKEEAAGVLQMNGLVGDVKLMSSGNTVEHDRVGYNL